MCKRFLIAYAGNEGPDQPADLRILIRAFIVILQNQ